MMSKKSRQQRQCLNKPKIVNDPTPHANKTARLEWEANLKALKARKLQEYLDRGAEMGASLGWSSLPILKLPKIKEPKPLKEKKKKGKV